MKMLAIVLVSLAIFASGAVLSEISKLSDIFGAGVTRLSEDVMELNVKVFCTEIDLWLKLGYQSVILKRMIKMLALPDSFQKSKWRSLPSGLQSTAKCIICRSVTRSIIRLRKTGAKDESIINVVEKLCADLNIAAKSVCHGVIRLNLPIIFNVIDRKPNITSRDFCGVLLQSESCATTSADFDWTVEVDSSPSRKINYQPTNETFNIVQLSDIHYDPKYEPNGNINCDEPVCCRAGQNQTNDNGGLAGFWGDYNNCDTPWHSVMDTFDNVAKNHQETDIIYFTGDIIDHGVWETSSQLNAKSIVRVYNNLKKRFPRTLIYPILGNHEPHPLNVFAPSSITNETLSTKWLYELVADIWIKYGWLPESARSTILKGGFYTALPRKGFRVIALNNNVCYIYNWWILYEPKDPDGQLKWLAETLLEAEKRGEFVHILAHLPPGNEECLRSWSRAYRKIINRFAHIITAEFNGHTHNDEMKIFYSLENRDDAISVAWNGGSITTYINRNPNYRVYAVNQNNYNVENVKTWIYNLTQANSSPQGNPQWFVSYSFKQEYGLNDLSMKSINDWLKRLSLNQTLALQYYSHFVKQADPSIKQTCDPKCMKDIACTIVTTDNTDGQDCERLAKHITDNLLGNPRLLNIKVNQFLPERLSSIIPKFLRT